MDKIREVVPLDGLINVYGSTEGGGSCGSVTEPWVIRRSTVRSRAGRNRDRDHRCRRETSPRARRGRRDLLPGLELHQRLLPRPIGTVACLDNEGFFHSGDLGLVDAEEIALCWAHQRHD